MYIYIGEKPKWDIYVSCLQINTQKSFQFFFFFHFKCILLQITNKSQKMFFINIFILGRSGVNVQPHNSRLSVTCNVILLR